MSQQSNDDCDAGIMGRSRMKTVVCVTAFETAPALVMLSERGLEMIVIRAQEKLGMEAGREQPQQVKCSLLYDSGVTYLTFPMPRCPPRASCPARCQGLWA